MLGSGVHHHVSQLDAGDGGVPRHLPADAPSARHGREQRADEPPALRVAAHAEGGGPAVQGGGGCGR